MLTDAEIVEIERRANDATEGPWFRETHGVMNEPRSYTVCMTGDSAQDVTDADFIACARTDVPVLVVELCEARVRVAELEAQIETAERQRDELATIVDAILDTERDADQHHEMSGYTSDESRAECDCCGYEWPCIYEQARAALDTPPAEK